MKIDLNNHKNLCKDSRQKIIVSRDDKEKSVGKKCEHKATNKNLSLVRHFKVDGDILIDGKKCDFLLLNDDKKEAYLIELKRSKLLEAIEQLDSSYAKIKSALPEYQFFFRISHSTSNTHTIKNRKIIRWREKHGRTFDGRPIAELNSTPYEEDI